MDSLIRFLPIFTFILGGGLIGLIIKFWDRLHPETCVHYSVRTTRIPLPTTPNSPFDTFAEVTIHNPSRRIRATNIGITILIPTPTEVLVGEIRTPEQSGRFCLSHGTRVLSDDADYMQIELTAERLAPRSYITVPIWYLVDEGEFAVKGTTDQCVVTKADESESSNMVVQFVWVSMLSIMLVIAAATMISVFWPPQTLQLGNLSAEALRGTSLQAESKPASSREVTLATTPPSIPHITLVDPNTINVESDSQAIATSLIVAETESGEFRRYSLLQPNERVVRLASPHTELWLRAYSWNDYGDSKMSDALHVPASVAKEFTPTP